MKTTSSTSDLPSAAAIDEVADKLRQELRRGAIVLVVLGQLHTERYGYSLRQNLARGGIDIDEGTLYPLLRRLQKQGLLSSEWREEDKRRKRFYRRSPLGDAVLQQLRAEWALLDAGVQQLTAGGPSCK